jgi:hypothetical protein
MSSASNENDFGRDHGLLHEAVVTGRKAGWGADEWAKLAHDVERMRQVREVLHGRAAITMVENAVATAVPATLPPLFSVVAVTNLGAIPAKKTAKCFVGGIWNPSWRDGDLDRWLAANQQASGECQVTTVAFSRAWKFVDAAVEVLKIAPSTDIVCLGNLLIERSLTLTLTQAEAMTVQTEKGEKTEMRVDGYGNFYFTETGDSKNPVAVGSVFRGVRYWVSDVARLGSSLEWLAEDRFLLRNFKLDTPTLGT